VLLGIDQGAMLAGPAIGGALLQWTGPSGLLGAIAALSLTTAITVTADVPRAVPAERTVERSSRASGWATLRSLPSLAWLVAGLGVSNLASGTLQAAAPVMVVRNWGHSSAAVGAVWSLAAVATLLVVAICRPAIDRWGLWRVGTVAATAASAACLAVAQTHRFTVYAVLVALLMASESGMAVVLRTLRSQLIPPDAFAPTLATTVLLLLLPFPLAGVLVACTPPNFLGHVLTALAAAQAVALAVAFAKARKAVGSRDPASASPG
jgi:hypothetical protein